MKARTHKLLLVLSVTGLLFAFVVISLLLSKDESPPAKRVAPDFSIELMDGSTFQLSAYKGKPVLINFFASWCHPCREESPTLVKIQAEYAPKGVTFLAIAVDDTAKDVNKFIERLNFTLPVGLDTTGEIKDAFKLYGLPTTYFINRKGVINYFHPGTVTEELLRHELDQIL